MHKLLLHLEPLAKFWNCSKDPTRWKQAISCKWCHIRKSIEKISTNYYQCARNFLILLENFFKIHKYRTQKFRRKWQVCMLLEVDCRKHKANSLYEVLVVLNLNMVEVALCYCGTSLLLCTSRYYCAVILLSQHRYGLGCQGLCQH